MENQNIKRRKLRRTEIDDDTLIKLYVKDRLSVYAIAKLLNFEYMTIRNRLIRAGVYESGGHKLKGDIEEIDNTCIYTKDIESITLYNNGIVFNMCDNTKKGFRVTNNRLYPLVNKKEEADEQLQKH